MYSQMDPAAVVACNLFGYGINVSDFAQRLDVDPDRKIILTAVAHRVFFVDRLRYRTEFLPAAFLGTPELAHSIEIEKQALELHLLCTCVDALAGEDFIDFPEWLNLRKPSKKTKYNVDDSVIRLIIENETHDLHDPDTFRHAAACVYNEAYLPHQGNWKAFLRFFRQLPPAVQQLLGAIYVVSRPLDETAVSWHFETGMDMPNDIRNWLEALKEWQTLQTPEKMDRIASYFYYCHRNPYTHRAHAIRPQQIEDRARYGFEDTTQGFDPFNDVIKRRDNSYYIRKFNAAPKEDEALILRLVVAAGWLEKLGYQIDEKFVEGYRRHQNRRERMYAALAELTQLDRAWRAYQLPIKEHPLYGRTTYPELIPLATFEISAVKEYLHDTPLENGIRNQIENCLSQVKQINIPIVDFNTTHPIPSDTGFSGLSPEKQRAMTRLRDNAYQSVQEKAKSIDLSVFLVPIWRWLDDLSDRMVF